MMRTEETGTLAAEGGAPVSPEDAGMTMKVVEAILAANADYAEMLNRGLAPRYDDLSAIAEKRITEIVGENVAPAFLAFEKGLHIETSGNGTMTDKIIACISAVRLSPADRTSDSREVWYGSAAACARELLSVVGKLGRPDLRQACVDWQAEILKGPEREARVAIGEREYLIGLVSAQGCLEKGKLTGAGVGFDRIRRITGYLVGTLDRFNNAKAAEERDRVKHGMSM